MNDLNVRGSKFNVYLFIRIPRYIIASIFLKTYNIVALGISLNNSKLTTSHMKK